MYTFACVNTKTHFSHHTKKKKRKERSLDSSTESTEFRNSPLRKVHRSRREYRCSLSECRMHTLEFRSLWYPLCETGNAPPTLFIFIFFFLCVIRICKKKDVTPLMGERSRTIVRLVQPRIFSTSDVILCNFIKHHFSVNPELFFRSEIFFSLSCYPFFSSFRFRDCIINVFSSSLSFFIFS